MLLSLFDCVLCVGKPNHYGLVLRAKPGVDALQVDPELERDQARLDLRPFAGLLERKKKKTEKTLLGATRVVQCLVPAPRVRSPERHSLQQQTAYYHWHPSRIGCLRIRIRRENMLRINPHRTFACWYYGCEHGELCEGREDHTLLVAHCDIDDCRIRDDTTHASAMPGDLEWSRTHRKRCSRI